MDTLTALEPQFAIPVILVVLGAVLVYLFGFKQTEEPSLEHLAVLQSSSSYKNRQVQPKSIPTTKGTTSSTAKAKANGTVSNGVPGKKVVATNKENVKPQQPPRVQIPVKKERENVRDPANKPEDFESGEWIPAVTRKEKAKKKEAPPSPKKIGGGSNKTDGQQRIHTGSSDLEEIPAGSGGMAAVLAAATTGGKAPKIEDVLAVLKESEKPNQSPKPTLEKKKDSYNKDSGHKKKGKEIHNKAPEPAPAPEPEQKILAPQQDEEAFDEMGGGDIWEKPKSRGDKKRRARRD